MNGIISMIGRWMTYGRWMMYLKVMINYHHDVIYIYIYMIYDYSFHSVNDGLKGRAGRSDGN